MENETADNLPISGKVQEYEFDSLGRVIYQISSYNDGYHPFAEYGRGSELEFSEYNDQNLRTYFCKEDYQLIFEHFLEYDKDGNIVLSETIHEGKNISGHDKRSFEWKKGKMVRSRNLLSDEEGRSNPVFNSSGLCTERSFGNSKFTARQEESADTISYIQEYLRDDSLVSIETWSELKQFKGLRIYQSKKNHKGELESEEKIGLDPYGNINYYFTADYTPVSWQEGVGYESQSALEISMVNHYNENGLITKQEFFGVDFVSGEKQLMKVYRFVYEESPLRFKFKQGELRAREIEQNESYGPDY